MLFRKQIRFVSLIGELSKNVKIALLKENGFYVIDVLQLRLKSIVMKSRLMYQKKQVLELGIDSY